MPTPTYTDTTLSNLIISKISQAKFNELKEEGLLNENELYIVENETLDAMGNVVQNVGTPVLSSDAANKAYVDGKQVPIATTSVPGIVKPDGTSLSVNSNGTLNVITSAFVPSTRTINGKALSSNITLTAADLSAVSINAKWVSAMVTNDGLLVGGTDGIYTAKYGTVSIEHNFPDITSSYTLIFPAKTGTLLVDSDLLNLDYLPLSGGVVSNYVSIIGQDDMVPTVMLSSVNGIGNLTLQDGAGVCYLKLDSFGLSAYEPIRDSQIVATLPISSGRLVVDSELSNYGGGGDYLPLSGGVVSNYVSIIEKDAMVPFATISSVNEMGTLTLQDGAGVYYTKIDNTAITVLNPFIAGSDPVVATMPTENGRLIVDTELNRTLNNFVVKNNAQISSGLSVLGDGWPFFSTSLDDNSLPALALDLAGVFYVKINPDAISVNGPSHSSPVVATWPLSSGRLIVDTELSNYTPSIATSATVGLVKPDNNTITVDPNGTLSANVPVAGYNFNTVTLTSQTIDDVTTLCGELSNHAINIVQITSADTPVQLTMPAVTSDGTARDFLLRMEITSSTVPMITFVPYTGDTLDFESLDGWTEFAPGINLLTFAETKPGA